MNKIDHQVWTSYHAWDGTIIMALHLQDTDGHQEQNKDDQQLQDTYIWMNHIHVLYLRPMISWYEQHKTDHQVWTSYHA